MHETYCGIKHQVTGYESCTINAHGGIGNQLLGIIGKECERRKMYQDSKQDSFGMFTIQNYTLLTDTPDIT